MTRSVLASLVNGTRQLLGAQLIISVVAIALAGWTLTSTNETVRERDRLRERVVQLEETLAAGNIVVPAVAPIVERAVSANANANAYPPPMAQAAPAEAPSFNPAQALSELFAPAPPLSLIVIHARSAADGDSALRLEPALTQATQARVVVNVLPPRAPHASGYSYFDGRQGRAAAALVQTFNDLARAQNIASWSAQLRGVALPAQGEYRSDRLDIVLPPLPQPPPAPAETVAP